MSEEKVVISREVLDGVYRVMEANKEAYDKEVKAHKATRQQLEMAIDSWKEEVAELKEELETFYRAKEKWAKEKGAAEAGFWEAQRLMAVEDIHRALGTRG